MDESRYYFSGDINKHVKIYTEREGNISKMGIFDAKTGKIQIPCIYRGIMFISDGIFKCQYWNEVYSQEQPQMIMDLNGNILTEADNIQYFGGKDNNSEYIPVIKESLYGYIDKNGKQVIDFQYRGAGWFYNGIAAVNTYDEQLKFIDKNNKILKTIDFDKAYYNLNEYSINGKVYYLFRKTYDSGDTEEHRGVMDSNFEMIIPYDTHKIYMENYNENILIVKPGNGSSIYNVSSGEEKEININIKNRHGVIYHKNYIIVQEIIYINVKESVKAEVYNLDGKLLADNVINYEITFDDKYIWIVDGLYKGYIDTEGNWLFKDKLIKDLHD